MEHIMEYDKDDLEALTRKELQGIAKKVGVKANQKSDAIIQELVEAIHKFNEENAEDVSMPPQEMETEMISIPPQKQAVEQPAKPLEEKLVVIEDAAPVSSMSMPSIKIMQTKTNTSKESTIMPPTSNKRKHTVAMPPKTPSRFDEQHKKLFDMTPSIVDTLKKRKLAEKRQNDAHSNKRVKLNLGSVKAVQKPKRAMTTSTKKPLTKSFAKENNTISKPKATLKQKSNGKKTFDLQESLKRKPTWQMKTGPLKPLQPLDGNKSSFRKF